MSSLRYDEDEEPALKLLYAVKDDFNLDECQRSKSLIANGEWDFGLDLAVSSCLSRERFQSVDGIAELIGAVRKTENLVVAYDRMLLTMLQNARAGDSK